MCRLSALRRASKLSSPGTFARSLGANSGFCGLRRDLGGEFSHFDPLVNSLPDSSICRQIRGFIAWVNHWPEGFFLAGGGFAAQTLCILNSISYPRGVMSDPVQSTSEQPKWARPDFREFYKEKCLVEEREDGTKWHFGSGIGPAAHPLSHSIPMSQFDCASCGGIYPYLTVVAATQGSKSAYGEGPWTYEFLCDSCGRYNQVVKEG